jgi:putative OPT family oligopeptide transporter
VRGMVLGVVITIAFTAANVYFGLKAALTLSTSIPAAVISMAVLRKLQGVTVQENNIVQTVASAAGTLSSIIFVLPGLVMVGWWTGFPFWTSFAVCALGGTLGVMYSIPLRRALVTDSDLPYPEGVACAEVLKVGAGSGKETAESIEAERKGLRAVVVGSVVSALFAVVVATQLFATDVFSYFRVGGDGKDRGAITGYDFALSLALFGVGHLVGLSVGMAMLFGLVIAWGFAAPWLTLNQSLPGDVTTVALDLWSHKIRFIGAGVIGVAAIWTLLRLMGPLVGGLRSAIAASRVRRSGAGATLPVTERDIPIGTVGLVILTCMLPIAGLLAAFAKQGGLDSQLWTLVLGGVVFIVLMSFLVSAVCGYMAGMIGASNSPLSGIGILAAIGASLLLVVAVKPYLPASAGSALVAFALFTTAVVFAVATIANNNLQDLKTGQLVGATPWKQQLALVVGVVAGALVIPPVLELLNKAYGFAGAPGVDPARALAAPQASLISALAKGVITNQADWSMIAAGACVGAVLILIDAGLGRAGWLRLPPLAVGLGIYLPISTSLMISVGSLVGWWYERRASRSRDPEGAKQLGVLLASGLFVGESLMGVALASAVVLSGTPAPLGLVSEGFANGPGQWIGGAAFVALIVGMYRWLERLAAKSA